MVDDGKRLILMAWTSVRPTNGSPKLGKPLAGRSEGVKPGQPTLTPPTPPAGSLQNEAPCQAPHAAPGH